MGKYNYKAEQLAFRLFLIATLSSVLSVFRIFVPVAGSSKLRSSYVEQAWTIIKRRLLLYVAGVVSLLRASKFYGQATKGARWMPWQKQAMKDVASCDKLRGAAHRR